MATCRNVMRRVGTARRVAVRANLALTLTQAVLWTTLFIVPAVVVFLRARQRGADQRATVDAAGHDLGATL